MQHILGIGSLSTQCYQYLGLQSLDLKQDLNASILLHRKGERSHITDGEAGTSVANRNSRQHLMYSTQPRNYIHRCVVLPLRLNFTNQLTNTEELKLENLQIAIYATVQTDAWTVSTG